MLSDAFSVPGRMRISLLGLVLLVVFCGIANRKLFDFDALRMPILLAKAWFRMKNSISLMFYAIS